MEALFAYAFVLSTEALELRFAFQTSEVLRQSKSKEWQCRTSIGCHCKPRSASTRSNVSRLAARTTLIRRNHRLCKAENLSALVSDVRICSPDFSASEILQHARRSSLPAADWTEYHRNSQAPQLRRHMNTGVGHVMRYLEFKLAGQYSGCLQCRGLPAYIMQSFVFLRPFVGHRHVCEMQILYTSYAETRLNCLLVALCRQNMDFNAASSEVSCPVPPNSRLTTRVRPTCVRRK